MTPTRTVKPRLLFIALSFGALGLSVPLSQCRKSEVVVPQRVSFQAISPGIADSFSGQKAFEHVERMLVFGPRPPSSEGYERTLAYLEETLADFGWNTTRQTFRAATPDGPIDFTNLLARHASAPAYPASLPVVIGGHIDSKKLAFPFVGANDGGSSTGIMLEIARVLSGNPSAATQIELVFFDGEEAFRSNITPTDGLYGSKHFAHDLSTRQSWPAIGIVLDIVGDPDHPLFYNPETPKSFATSIESIASTIPFEHGLIKAPGSIIDDHVPLQNTGLPCLHLIGDFTAMDYWHQSGDTLDKISPEMLEQVGKLTLRFLSEAQPPTGN